MDNLLDPIFDAISNTFDFLFVKHPKRGFSLLAVILLFVGVTQREWLIDVLPYDESQINQAVNWVQWILVGALATFILFLIIRHIFSVFRIQRSYEYVQLLPHSDNFLKAEELSGLLRKIHGTHRKVLGRTFKGREWYSYIIHRSDANEGTPIYRFYLGAEHEHLQAIKSLLKTDYTQMNFLEVEDLPVPSKKAVGGRLKLKSNSLKKSLPLARYRSDHLPELLAAMESSTWLQIGFSANDGWKLRKAINQLETDLKNGKRASDRSGTEQNDLKGLQHRYSGNEVAFDVTVSLATEFYPGVQVLKNMANTIGSFTDDSNHIRFRKLKDSVQWYPTSKPGRMVWTGSELANLIHMPDFKQNRMNSLSQSVAHTARGLEYLPENVMGDAPDSVKVGTQYSPFFEGRDIKLSIEHSLSKHFLSTGKNGSGKSSLVNNLVTGLLERFYTEDKAVGFSFIDPAGATVEAVLNQLMKAEADGKTVNWDKVHWIQFAKNDFPVGMNLLEKMPEDEDGEKAVADVMSIIWGNFMKAPQTERLLRNSIKALILDPGETHTILGVKQLINDEMFRLRVLNRVRKLPEGVDVYDFFANEAPDMMDQSKIPLFNRLDAFSSNSTLRRLFGQKEFHLPLREWMDEGHIVLYDCRGLDEEMLNLIGGYLAYKYYRVADLRDEQGDPHRHFCFIDETQLIESAADVLAKAIQTTRKKGLSFGVLTQAINQLGQSFRDALREAQGTYFVNAQGGASSKEAEETFKINAGGKSIPVYSEVTLRTLPTRVAAIKIMVSDTESHQTLVKSDPLDLYFKDGTLAPFHDKEARAQAKAQTAEVARWLAQKKGYHRDEVDKMILAYKKGEEYEPKKSVRSSKPFEAKPDQLDQLAPVRKQPKVPDEVKPIHAKVTEHEEVEVESQAPIEKEETNAKSELEEKRAAATKKKKEYEVKSFLDD